MGEAAKVGTSSRLQRCIILDGVQIGERVELCSCIVDEGCVIEDDVKLEMPTVLAAGSRLTRGTLV